MKLKYYKHSKYIFNAESEDFSVASCTHRTVVLLVALYAIRSEVVAVDTLAVFDYICFSTPVTDIAISAIYAAIKLRAASCAFRLRFTICISQRFECRVRTRAAVQVLSRLVKVLVCKRYLGHRSILYLALVTV